ncbi:hypothetical protein O7634_24515 [Micromonospora sp. WMMD1120]|uniref:hypothetical protein n=1 Tax=Micromonospora sp. WMMD1120 TaxID=3016106 RepID=UPI002417DD6B|nr:hypothetical protein [Micromonospora sp. WMMD1120]MDG4809927.1 hypothetical protein [Micromonospora sp. WMMD1120]
MSERATDKVRENRLRRMAERQGLALIKSRRRDPRALDFGLYWLIESGSSTTQPSERGASLDEIEARLVGDVPTMRPSRGA